jgi:beta-1,2-mannobiose phosphorylase / 1,2-beta-oligomannan phosphorylase
MIERCMANLVNLALLALFVASSPPPTPPLLGPPAQKAEKPRTNVRQADSSWPLVHWKPIAQNPVFAGTGRDTWDRKIRERGYILTAEDGTYDLWYTGYAGDHPAKMLLGHAASRDGIHWNRDASNPIFTDSWVEDMCVLHHDGSYSMVAEGKSDVAHLLKSTNGRTWIDQGALDIRKRGGKPIEPGPYGTPTLWFENGTWYLYYERGDQGIWLAVSKDQKTWINVQDEPVITMGPEAYDKTAVALNQVVKRGDWYYGFYHANSNRPWKNWTTCIARSRDLVHWEKYPQNPIVQNNCSSAILVQTPQGDDRLYTMHPDVKVFVPE